VDALRASLGAFRGVFHNPNLRRLQFAWIGSVAGQYSYSIAIAIYAYRHGGAAAVGAIALVRSVPAAVLGPFIAGLGDRFRRDRVMLGADLTRAGLVSFIAFATFAHLPWPVVFGVAAFGPICGMAFHPAQSSPPADTRTDARGVDGGQRLLVDDRIRRRVRRGRRSAGSCSPAGASERPSS